MSGPLSVVASLGYGFASAFVPVLNAEAYIGVHAVAAPLVLVLVVVAVGIGQTAGKVVMFEGARSGRRMMHSRSARRERRDGPVAFRLRRWNARMLRLLERPRAGAVTVLSSASLGVPPLAAVSIVAGTSSQRRATFVLCCLAGRIARFAVLAAPLAYAT